MKRLIFVLSLFASIVCAQEPERPMRREAPPERSEQRREEMREWLREAPPEVREHMRERLREARRERMEGRGEGERPRELRRAPGQGQGPEHLRPPGRPEQGQRGPGERRQGREQEPRQRGGMAGPRGRAHMLRMQILRHHLRHLRELEGRPGQHRNRAGEQGTRDEGPRRFGPGERPPRPDRFEGEGHRRGIRV